MGTKKISAKHHTRKVSRNHENAIDRLLPVPRMGMIVDDTAHHPPTQPWPTEHQHLYQEQDTVGYQGWPHEQHILLGRTPDGIGQIGKNNFPLLVFKVPAPTPLRLFSPPSFQSACMSSLVLCSGRVIHPHGRHLLGSNNGSRSLITSCHDQPRFTHSNSATHCGHPVLMMRKKLSMQNVMTIGH